MSSTSTNLQLIDLVQGESASGSFTNWGDVTDGNLAILERTVSEVTSKSVTTLDVTLSATEELSLVILATGVLTGNRNIITSGRKGFWFVKNNCTGAFTLTFKTSAGTGVVVPQGGKSILFCDGTNIQSMDLTAATPTDGNFLVGDGTTFVGESGATARASLGLVAVTTDNAIIRADGVLGQTQTSVVTIGDTGSISGVNTLSAAVGVFSGALSADSVSATFFRGASGSAAIPSLSFTGSGSTGLYIAATNKIGVSCAGAGNIFFTTTALCVGSDDQISTAVFDTGFSAGYDGHCAIVTLSDSCLAMRRFGGVGGVIQTFVDGAGASCGTIVTSTGATAYNTSSDKRMKKNFRDFDSDYILDRLVFGQFEWIHETATGYGVLAQDAEEVFPPAISINDEGIFGADYSKYVPVVARSLQKLRARVADQDAVIAQLLERVTALEARQ